MSNSCRDGGRLLTQGTSRISCLGVRFQRAAQIWHKCHNHHRESGISSDWKENDFLLKVCVPSQHFCLLVIIFYFPLGRNGVVGESRMLLCWQHSGLSPGPVMCLVSEAGLATSLVHSHGWKVSNLASDDTVGKYTKFKFFLFYNFSQFSQNHRMN